MDTILKIGVVLVLLTVMGLMVSGTVVADPCFPWCTPADACWPNCGPD